MAFTDLLDLRTAVVEETGSSDLVDRFPRLVRLAEARLNRELRTRHQITTVAVTISGGVALVPSDYVEAIGLFDASGCEMVQRPYQLAGQQVIRGDYSLNASQIIGEDGEYTLHYYAAIPTISGSLTASNWLLQAFPAVYLWAVTAEAEKSLRRVEEASASEALARAEIANANAADMSERYARGSIRVQGVTP